MKDDEEYEVETKVSFKEKFKDNLDAANGISEAHRIVLREVNKIQGWKKYSHKGVSILCPFHSGDSDPSCGIYTAPDGKVPIGWTYCLGCGASVHWNVLADKLGLAKIQESQTKRDTTGYSSWSVTRMKKKMLTEKMTLADYMADWGMGMELPFLDVQWRGICGDLIKALGCKIGIDKREKIPFLIMPVYVRGKLISAIKARIVKRSGLVSYVIADDSPLKEKGLFPYDFVREMIKNDKKLKWVVLVEGQRDALRLIQYGIPAVAILGSRSWDAKKMRLLASLSNNIVVSMDGDVAGCSAAKLIKNDLKEDGSFQVKSLNLMKEAKRIAAIKGISVKEAKVDPGNMSIEFIETLQELNYTTRKHLGKVAPRWEASVKEMRDRNGGEYDVQKSDAIAGKFKSVKKVRRYE